MRFSILIIIFSCFCIFLQAQDGHFSQNEISAYMRNPATIGIMKYDQKITASYRSQWTDIPDAYRNIALSYEQKISKFSWGLNILHNDAGKASLKTSHAMLNFSYQKRLSNRGEFLSIGASGGIIQQRFDPTLFKFDNQYIEGSGFNPNLSNNEAFTKTNQILPSATVGIYVSKFFNRIKGSAGLSFAHLNEPSNMFFETIEESYPMRTSFFAKTQIPVKDGLEADIHFSWNQQSVAHEKIIGAKLKYQLNPNNSITGGISNRINDAWILEVGIILPNNTFVLSYDMNNSSLNSVTNSKGAWELSASYFLNKKKKAKASNAKFEYLNTSPRRNNVGEKDTDGDGILDKIDDCPTVYGLARFNGCIDTDEDGIWDSIDACPHLFGEKSNQGCPSNKKDSDSDGLLDEIDKCPFLKGTAEMGGCPDSDKDGISDMEDYCPFLKGVVDNNGCPRMNKENHRQFLEKKSVSAIVEFDTNKSFVKSYYETQLNEVLVFLLQNPESKAFISGHTDDEGDQMYNYRLGEQRANSVTEFLLKRGVSFSQISMISYGETKPILMNRSEFEKAKNRRVEVQVILE